MMRTHKLGGGDGGNPVVLRWTYSQYALQHLVGVFFWLHFLHRIEPA